SGKLELLAEIQLERILATLEKAKPEIAVVDSIQTLYSEQLTSAPGSVAQVRECVAHLTRYAKASGAVVVLVGHVTKEGAIAGPHRHAGIACYDQDVFVNAVGGVRISEPAADLAVLLAIVSSHVDKPLPAKLAVFGEIGLAGEVRPAPRGQERLREAAKLGFTQAIVPRANQPKQKIDGLEIVAVERVVDAIARFRA